MVSGITTSQIVTKPRRAAPSSIGTLNGSIAPTERTTSAGSSSGPCRPAIALDPFSQGDHRRHRQWELRRIELCFHTAIEYGGSKVNTYQMKGNWKQFVGKAKEKWG